MCKVQMLRALVEQRLTAAAQEIFGLFERTLAEYEEELCGSKEENQRLRRLLDAGLDPQPRSRAADVQQLLVVKEEGLSLDQEDQEDPEDPEPPHIKEEQEELWTSQEGEQLQGLEEADITKFLFTPVPVKSEDDEEEPQSSQLHQRHTEHMEPGAAGEDCGGPGPHRDSDPDDEAGDSSEPETDDSNDWKETREPQSGLDSLNNEEVPVSDGEKPFSCSECGKRFRLKKSLKRHMRIHTGEKLFSCSLCEKAFRDSGSLRVHMRSHTGEKPFGCPFCKKSYKQSGDLQRHISVHTGQKRFSCSVCNQRFTWLCQLRNHKCVGRQSSHLHQTEEVREAEPPASSSAGQMEPEATGEDFGGPDRNPDQDRHPDTVDKTGVSSEPDDSDDLKETREPQLALNSLNSVVVLDSEGEKPFSCSDCGKRVVSKGKLKMHMMVHRKVKLFSCSVCDKSFTWSGDLQKHIRIHTGERPFSCSVCKKSFVRSGHLQRHVRIHTGEKPFSCSECGKGFGENGHLTRHMRSHSGEKPFNCSVCKKSFSRSGDVQIHMRIHTGEKPFGCSLCSKKFAVRANMTNHMAIHTGEKRFGCRVCKKKFTRRRQIKEHKCVGHQTEEIREAEPPAGSSAGLMETEADGEDCGGPDPDRNSDPETGDSSEPETVDNEESSTLLQL